MKNREYLRFPHIIAEIASHIIGLVSLILAVVMAATTKGDIPTHFDFFGEIDSYGSPWTGLLLPAILFVTNLGSSAILRFVPISSWNMPAKITENNKPFVYNDAVWTIVVTMITIAFMSLAGTICMFFFQKGFGVSMTVILAVGIAVMVGFIVKSVIDSKKYA